MNRSSNTPTVRSVSAKQAKKDLLLTLLRESVRMCYKKDYSLIRRKSMEQSSVARIYYYMQKALEQDPRFESLSTYKLDSEYNKNGEAHKMVDGVEGYTRPDIILHHREDTPCKDNILIIEFKAFNNYKYKRDIQKLESFTDPQYAYHYFLGVLVKLKKNEIKYTCFQNGHPCGLEDSWALE